MLLFLLFFIFFAYLCVQADSTYAQDSHFLDLLLNQIRSQNNNEIPQDLIMNFYIADVPANIVINETYVGSFYENLECAGEMNILRIKKSLRKQHHFKNVTILIDPRTFTNSSFENFFVKNIIGYKPILINQIIYGMEDLKVISLVDETSREHFLFFTDHLDDIDWETSPGSALYLRVIGIIRIIFGLFLASNITAIYFLIIIIGIPIFMMAIIECFLRFFDHHQINNFRFTLYKTFPWLGLYLHALNLNDKNQVIWMFMSQVGLMIIFYCIFVSLFEFLDSLLFVMSFPLGIDLKFYILIVVMEVTSFLFIRTRTSLKFFPKMVFIFLFTFCFYIQFNGYAFYNEAFLCLVFACLFFLCLFISFIEIPALSWNPSYHYTPSIEKPRTLYNPLFSMSWYYDLPHLWTMFYPLHDRSTFTENEMALIDRKYLVLNQLLNNPGHGQHQGFNGINFQQANEMGAGINNLEANSIVNNRPEVVRNRLDNEIRDQLLPQDGNNGNYN